MCLHRLRWGGDFVEGDNVLEDNNLNYLCIAIDGVRKLIALYIILLRNLEPQLL